MGDAKATALAVLLRLRADAIDARAHANAAEDEARIAERYFLQAKHAYEDAYLDGRDFDPAQTNPTDQGGE